MQNLDHSSPVPVNEQISDWMRQNILTGAWSNNQKLQSESDLAERLQVSRGTIRKAIETLIDEHLLVRTHGKGTFVQQLLVLEQKPTGRIAGFSRDLISRGIPYRTKVFLNEVKNPETEIAQKLSISPEDKIFHLKRLRIVQEKPVVYVENHIVCSYCRGIEEIDFAEQPLYTTLEDEFDFNLDWAQRTYRSMVADEIIAKTLELEVGAPVAYLEELYHLVGDIPVEYTKAWIDAEVFYITTRIKREEEKRDTPVIFR